MALFFAIVPDGDLRTSLREAIPDAARMALEAAGIRWADDNELHLTLLHLRKVPGPHRLIRSATQELKNVGAFEVDVLEPVDHREQSGRRVIFAPCRQRDRFNDLLKACQAAARQAGLEPSESEFQAHITLGRSPGERDRCNWPVTPNGQAIGILRVREVRLLESVEGHYTELSVVHLKTAQT